MTIVSTGARKKAAVPGKSNGPGKKRVPGARKIVSDLLPGFSRKLSSMLDAGLPIVASLSSLERQANNPSLKILIGDVRALIENGVALSDSLARFPSVFDELYTSLVRAGESSGQLSETLARLASMLEANAKLRRKVKGAMMYPVVVLCIAAAIVTGMMLFILPIFAEMFDSFNQKLPAPTLFLIRASDFLREYIVPVVICLGAGLFLFKRWKATEAGGYIMDQLILKMPVFGDLTSKLVSARFARTLAQLVRSGVPILTALEIAAASTGNKVAAKIVLEARKVVEQGDLLSSALISQSVFDPMLLDMLQAGEKSGKVDKMMDFSADHFDDEVNTTLDGLASLLEPLLMVFLGVVIGGIVVCMFLPIFKLPGAF